MKKPYNEQLEGALALERLLKKYIYVTEKIQNEVIKLIPLIFHMTSITHHP